MKRYLIILVALFLAITAVRAQKSELETFRKQLSALAGDGVEYEENGADWVKNQLLVQLSDQMDDSARNVFTSIFSDTVQWRISTLTTTDEEGYKRVCSFVDKYEIDSEEELFGVPLMVSNREDGAQTVLFADDNNTLVFENDADEETYSIFMADCNIIEFLQQTLLGVLDAMGDAMVSFGDNVSYSLNMGGSKLIDFTNIPGKSHCEDEKEAVPAKKQGPVECDSIEYPSFVQRDGKRLVAIPTVSEEFKQALVPLSPYVAKGIYDWINNTGFGNGTSQVCEIITPYSVVEKYRTENPSTTIEYPAESLKAFVATEYQGGVPAVLCRKSISPDGYKEMLASLSHFFALKVGERYENLKVTNRITTPDGKRFVQLYGDREILACIYDSPADDYCFMNITIGHDSAFEAFLNAFTFDGENKIAAKHSIVINEDGLQITPAAESKGGVSYQWKYLKELNLQ